MEKKIYIDVVGQPSEFDDEGVPGVYLVTITDPELPETHYVSAALDCFHEHVGIECLDDFEISTYDEEGNVLFEEDGIEPYSYSGSADFYGVVDEVPRKAPTP